MSLSYRSPAKWPLVGAAFAVVVAGSALLGAGLALNGASDLLCATVSSGTVGVVEGRGEDSILLRIPPDTAGSIHSCTGDTP